MAVLGDHAIADDLGALRQVLGQDHQNRLPDSTGSDFARFARGIDQAHDGRRHAFVEVQLHHLRRQREHAAVSRFRGNERRMGPRRARQAERRQQRGNTGERSRHPDGLWLRYQLEARRRRRAVMPASAPTSALALLRNIDPAADALLAFLHDGEIKRGVGLQTERSGRSPR